MLGLMSNWLAKAKLPLKLMCSSSSSSSPSGAVENNEKDKNTLSCLAKSVEQISDFILLNSRKHEM